MDAFRLFLHVLAASVWVGGQIVLAGLVPTVRGFGEDATRQVARAFNRIAWPAYARGGGDGPVERVRAAARGPAAPVDRAEGAGGAAVGARCGAPPERQGRHTPARHRGRHVVGCSQWRRCTWASWSRRCRDRRRRAVRAVEPARRTVRQLLLPTWSSARRRCPAAGRCRAGAGRPRAAPRADGVEPDVRAEPWGSDRVVLHADGAVEVAVGAPGGPLDTAAAGATSAGCCSSCWSVGPPVSTRTPSSPTCAECSTPRPSHWSPAAARPHLGSGPTLPSGVTRSSGSPGPRRHPKPPALQAARRRRRRVLVAVFALLVVLSVTVVLMAPRWWDAATEDGAAASPAVGAQPLASS